MTNKKRSSMAELCPAQSPWKNYLIIFSLLLLGLGFNSCKKDLLVPVTSSLDVANGKIKTISYSEFLSSINLDKTGSLKTALSSASKNSQGAIMNVSSGSNGFNINTDSIKRLTLGDTISYVISLKPETRHAVQFRNLTIQVLNDKTTAFLTTYIPTQEWVKDWKNKKSLGFKGEIYANKIDLSDLPKINGLNNSGQGSKGSIMSVSNATSEILINHNKISLAPGECEEYDVYETVMMPCKNGHYSRADCNYQDWYGDWEIVVGRNDWPPYEGLRYVGTALNCAPGTTPPSGGGDGGGGSTTPNPPGGYDPCDGELPTVSYAKVNNGLKLATLPPSPCDETGGSLPPLIEDEPFDENKPIFLPIDWDMQYPQSWFDEEDELDAVALLFAQQNAPPSSMIPEMYYINGVKVDMLNAPIKGGVTFFNVPRNSQYFWKQVITEKPQMFSPKNRELILSNPSKAPVVDAQWIKYNPTHKNYLNEPLQHHHEGQGRYAYAIPRKVHQKWSAILHQYKQTGKIPRIRPKINTLLGTLQVFTFLTDIQTGNPDAWVNWFGPHQDIGKIYKHPEKNVYFEITKQTTIKNTAGKVIRAKVTYDVYDDYIWDADENRYMGIIKLGTFTEYIDVDLGKTYQNPEQEWS